MGSAILGSGICVPSRVVGNELLAEVLGASAEWMYRKSGIRQRRYVDGETLVDLACRAGADALAVCGLKPEQIGALLFGSVSDPRVFPSSGYDVQARLGLRQAAVLDVQAPCTATPTMLHLADALIRAGTYRYIMLLGAEVQSPYLDFSPAGKNLTFLFGDGAGAVVLGRAGQGQILGTRVAAIGESAGLLTMTLEHRKCRPDLTPVRVRPADPFPVMDGQGLILQVGRLVPEFVEALLSDVGVRPQDVSQVVFHQANGPLIEMVARRIGFCRQQCFSNIERYGNTSNASIPICFHEAVACGRISRGDLVLLVGYGAGLSLAAALLRY